MKVKKRWSVLMAVVLMIVYAFGMSLWRIRDISRERMESDKLSEFE